MRMEKEFPRNYPQTVADVLEAMSLSKGKNLMVIGSGSLRNILYAGDYDSNENLKNLSPAQVAKGLKAVIRRLRKLKNVVVGDIKLGGTMADAIHWSPGEIIQGKLEPYIEQEARRKIDAVAFINGRYVELSTVYNYPSEIADNKQYIKELEADMAEQVREGNYWKALKRLFSIRRITAPKKAEAMIPLFNSELGLLYSVISDIEVLLYLMDLHKGNPELIKEEVQGFKGRLALIWQMPEFIKKEPGFDAALDKAATHPDDAVKILTHLSKSFRDILQARAKPIFGREK